MELAISILHVLVCIFLVLVILLQAGKGASVGAAFGGAGSQTVFGGRGAQTFLSKLTSIAAAIFFLTSLALSFASTQGRSVLEGEVAPVAAPTPAGDATPETPPSPVAPPSEPAAEGVQAPAPAAPAEEAPANP